MKIIFTFSLLFFLLQFAIGQTVDIYKRPVQAERSRNFDAIHYKVTLDVDLNKKILVGENQVTLIPLNDNFAKVIFDAEYLVVNSVINADGKALQFEQKDNQIIISLTQSYQHSDTVQFTVKYKLNK